MKIIPNYTTATSGAGIFTICPTIFTNLTDATIENILSENATKIYLKKRMTVNASFFYANFTTHKAALV